MVKIYFSTLILIVLVLGCSVDHNTKNNLEISDVTTDSLELELAMLKNEAFCMCFNRSIKKENVQITPPDGSSYIQLSDVVAQYANESNLNLIIDKWVKKEYRSYSDENKLYLMRCLDLYNSEDLDNYIDSVRIIHTTKVTY